MVASYLVWILSSLVRMTSLARNLADLCMLGLMLAGRGHPQQPEIADVLPQELAQ